MSDLLKRYITLKNKVTERKEQFKKLIEFMENETAWLSSPASTRFHLCRDRGLLEHSCNVAETMLKIKAVLAPEITDESCVIVALLHDLGKVGMPGNPQYLSNEATVKQKQYGYQASTPYRFNKDLTYLSVPVRSLYLASPYLKLSEEEAQAIVYHDGQYVQDNASVATNEKPLTLLLQYADNWCGFVIEAGEGKFERQ
ncbi:MAG TPA: HD domain-containing protein [Bacillota bacterium]|nr:HD domain-containing protein [Bacillota bacterium]